MEKIKLTFFLALAMLFSSIGVTAQQEFLTNGVLFERGTKTRIADAGISNKRNNYYTTTNSIGLFNIKVKVGDTLIFTKLYYNDMSIVVRSERDLVVELIKNTNTLNEVVISRRRVVDDLKRDFHGAPPPSGKVAPLGFIFSPISSIYGLLSTDGQNARRFSRYYNYEVKASKIDLFYNKSIIQKQTGLEGKELDDFLVTYRPDYEKAKNWTEYDGNKWIADSFKKYQELKKKP